MRTKRIPYPLRCFKVTVEFNPFGFWLKPTWKHRKELSEDAKRDGGKWFIFRWGQIQVSFSRWL